MKPQQQQTVVTAAGPVQPVLVSQPYQTTSVIDSYRHRQSTVIGALLIIAGALSVIFGIAEIAHLRAVGPNVGGTSVVCGVMVIITGGFGIAAARRKSRCTIITFMVLAIISAVFTGPEVFRSLAVAYAFRAESEAIALGVIMALLDACEFGLCLWGSILCCISGTGCCCASQPVAYTMQPAEEFVVQAHCPTKQQLPVYPTPPEYPGNDSK